MLSALALTAGTTQLQVSKYEPPQSLGLAGSDQGLGILSVDDAAQPSAADIALLVRAATSGDTVISQGAIRALGRIERRDVVPHVMPYLKGPRRAEAVFAIAQAMQGPPLSLDTAGSQVEAIQQVFIEMARNEEEAEPLAAVAWSLGRLPYDKPEQVAKTDELLRNVLRLHQLRLSRKQIGAAAPAIAGALKGAEQLGRLNPKLGPFSNELITTLRGHATERISEVGPNDRGPAAHAFMALVAVRGVDEDTLQVTLRMSNDAVRRLAVLTLSSGASPITGTDRGDALRSALRDRNPQVRYEALRGYARQQARTDGCEPIADALGDEDPHVALAAIDALGDACKGDENAVLRLIGEARTPPNVGRWQREAHALVALAKAAPQQAEIPVVTQSRHQVWQVRMYAARAAAVLDDVPTLERLAADRDENVREATLMALKRLKGNDAEPQFLLALAGKDYQALRTAARELEKLTPTRALSTALLDALVRVTAERKETSRDTRTALLERLREFGNADMQERLVPFLKDFDPKVADEAAKTLTALTGRTFTMDPLLPVRPPLPLATEIQFLQQNRTVLVMADDKRLELSLHADEAPLNCVRFLRLARAGYFNNLSFHRIVPNFVIQGGSPGANEYMGDGPFVRDEIRPRSHTARTLGLSTRGRDAGDAQIFVNLVDNLRLDFNYTVFGTVSGPVDDIAEGDVIREVRFLPRGK